MFVDERDHRLKGRSSSVIVFVFRSRKADRLKLFYWDGSCLVKASRRWVTPQLMPRKRFRSPVRRHGDHVRRSPRRHRR
ncbi:hypothetical protein GFL77_11795 [Rhizobium leguminosarum bv. viciae]|nr:hypothetical protein [Rhizobium leguminosarum bv. viciae]